MINNISKLRSFYCNRILPQVYDDSLSFEELLYNMNNKIQEIIDRTHTYDELFEEIKAIAENLKGTIKEETKKELQKLYENGTLKEVLQEIIKIDLVPRSSKLSIERISREIIEGRYSKKTNDNVFHRWQLQGNCVYTLNGKVAVTKAYSGMLNSQDTNEIDTEKNLIKLSTNYDIRTTPFIESETYYMCHCNGMTYNYDDGYIYAVAGTEITSLNPKKTGVSKLICRIKPDLTGFESKTIIPFYSCDIAYYKHKMYVLKDNSSESGIYEAYDLMTIDWNGNLSKVCTIHNQTNEANLNFDIANDKLFLLCNDKKIQVFDIKTGEFLWCYVIPNFDDTHCYEVNEVEGITVFDNGNFYLVTHGYDGFYGEAQCSKTQVFFGNYLKNANNRTNHEIVNNVGGNVFFVNTSSTVANPDGNQLTTAFKTINEAVQYCENHPNRKNWEIRVIGDHPLQFCNTSTKNIFIVHADSSGSVNPSRMKDNVDYNLLGGIFTVGAVGLTFDGFNIWNCSNGNLYGGKQKGTITIQNSNCHFEYCDTHFPNDPSKTTYSYAAITDSAGNKVSTFVGNASTVYMTNACGIGTFANPNDYIHDDTCANFICRTANSKIIDFSVDSDVTSDNSGSDVELGEIENN